MIFARPLDHIPDFDRLVVRSGHNLGPVQGKRHRHDVAAVGVLAQHLQLACQTSQQALVYGQGEAILRGLRRTRIPDFDSLVVRSRRDDLGPVRGKSDRIDFPAVGVRLLAQQLQLVCQTTQQASVLSKERGDFELAAHPDFDRPVSRSRHNLGPVRGERHRHDLAAVRVRLLRYTVDELLMSIAIILRTREKRRERLTLGSVCIRQHGDMGPHEAAS